MPREDWGRVWAHGCPVVPARALHCTKGRGGSSRRDTRSAVAAGGERALYLGAIRTRHGFTTVWDAAMRTRREECEEAGGDSGGAEAGGVAPPALGEWRGI